MPWKVSWMDAEESITLFEAEEPWTYEEFVEIVRQGQAMIRSKDYLIDSIFYLPEDFTLPGPNPLTHIKTVYATEPENNALNVIVGAGVVIQALLNIITSVMGGSGRFVFVSSMDEALAELERIRASRERV